MKLIHLKTEGLQPVRSVDSWLVFYSVRARIRNS